MGSTFLTAEMHHLLMASYEAEPAILAPLLPPGTEPDSWNGRTFLSLVALSLRDVRVKGMAIPFHRDFAEINLRFYVRAPGPEGWRHGVVFVREVVPRRAIAFVARWLFSEKFTACPTRFRIEQAPDSGSHTSGSHTLSYGWQHRGEWLSVSAEYAGAPASPRPGSAEEFIVQRYWGYTTGRDCRTTAYYRIEHPAWRVWPATRFGTDGDLAGFYGPQFAPVFGRQPSSVFVAQGSPVAVHPATPLEP